MVTQSETGLAAVERDCVESSGSGELTEGDEIPERFVWAQRLVVFDGA